MVLCHNPKQHVAVAETRQSQIVSLPAAKYRQTGGNPQLEVDGLNRGLKAPANSALP